jgi:hypothetical protein
MSKPGSRQPYRSAIDLPSFAELQEQLRGMKLLTRIVAREERAKVVELEAQLHRMAGIVDRFYDLLGQRNWVFHDDLNLERIAALVGEEATAESAEQGLVTYYQEPDTLTFMTRRLVGQPLLRPRMHLIEHALADYRAGRFYATTLVLLTVMDGFVNDVENRRKGLHARGADEMAGWDSVVGHHLGLSHAHRSFIKSTGATTGEETFELHRHGIMHGTILHFDNPVVATKAWNRLFAVVDWARSLARRDQPSPPKPSFRETLKQLAENQRTKEALAAWRPSVVTAADPTFEQQPVLQRTRLFLEAWRSRNYGQMATCLPRSYRGPTTNAGAGTVRAAYERDQLTSFEILRLNHEAAAVCEVDVRLTMSDATRDGRMRWIREKDNGSPAIAEDAGEWVLYLWDPHSIISRAKPST